MISKTASVVCFVAIASALQPSDETLDAEVYRAALAAVHRAVAANASQRHAVVASTYDPSAMWRDMDAITRTHAPYLDPRVRLAYAKPDTVTSFLRAAQIRSSLPTLALGASFELVSEKDLPVDADWSEFRKRTGLAAGAFSVSGIGYDAIGTQALVYVLYQCGMLCGSGHFVLLERPADRWRVVKVDLHVES